MFCQCFLLLIDSCYCFGKTTICLFEHFFFLMIIYIMIWLILLYFNVNWSNNSRRHIFSVYSSRNFFLWITIKLSLFNCEWISEMLLLLLVWIQSFLVVVVVVIVIILKRKNGFFFRRQVFASRFYLLDHHHHYWHHWRQERQQQQSQMVIFTNRNHQLFASVLSFFSGWTHNDCLLLLLKCEFLFIHSEINKPNESQNNSYRWWDTRWWWWLVW